MSNWPIQNYGGISVGDRVNWLGSYDGRPVGAVVKQMSVINGRPYVMIQLDNLGYLGGYLLDELECKP